jgi:hypothetical protein
MHEFDLVGARYCEGMISALVAKAIMPSSTKALATN